MTETRLDASDGRDPLDAGPAADLQADVSGDDGLPPDSAAGEAEALADEDLAPPAVAAQLFDVLPPPPKTAGVRAEDTIAEAGRKVLRFHFARLRLHEAGTRAGKNPEDLHRMRVATRRMRAAWRVFGDGFKPRRTARMRARLRDLAARLGAVRDLDVLLLALEAYQRGLEPADGAALEPLAAAWRDRRGDARRLLVREIDSPDFARLLDEYAAFLGTEGVGAIDVTGATQLNRVRDRATSRIWDAYEQLRVFERVLPWADVETLHELRIAGKWLRYTLEFFREALGPETPVLIARVVAIQDHLGALHDADVTAALVRAFLLERGVGLESAEARAIGGYLAANEREVVRLRRSFVRIWQPVAGPAFRRTLGRAVAAL